MILKKAQLDANQIVSSELYPIAQESCCLGRYILEL